MPKRGAVALGLTALALALLLNFQVPADTLTVGRPLGPNGAGGAGGISNGGASNGGASNDGPSTGPGGGTGSGGAAGDQGGGGTDQGGGGTNQGGGGATSSPDAAGSGGGTGSGGATGQRTVMGPVVDTRWGPVQVEVTVSGSQLVDVAALELPSGGRSSQISRFVEPILRSEALQAQSANIDGVSGATYTSAAYAQSLQAALDSVGG